MPGRVGLWGQEGHQRPGDADTVGGLPEVGPGPGADGMDGRHGVLLVAVAVQVALLVSLADQRREHTIGQRQGRRGPTEVGRGLTAPSEGHHAIGRVAVAVEVDAVGPPRRPGGLGSQECHRSSRHDRSIGRPEDARRRLRACGVEDPQDRIPEVPIARQIELRGGVIEVADEDVGAEVCVGIEVAGQALERHDLPVGRQRWLGLEARGVPGTLGTVRGDACSHRGAGHAVVKEDVRSEIPVVPHQITRVAGERDEAAVGRDRGQRAWI